MATPPLVTVVICYFNDKNFLSSAIESVLNQSFKDFELILLNHASTDGSRDIAHSFNDPRIIHIDTPKNLGAGSSYNFACILSELHGKYYKSFGADDIMHKECLKNLTDFALKHPEKDLIFGNLEYIGAGGNKLGIDWFHKFKGFSQDATEIDLMKMFSEVCNYLPCPGSLFKTDLLKKIKFDYSLTIFADMWLWASFLIVGAKVGFCNEIVGFYRCHNKQESNLDTDIMTWRHRYETSSFLSVFFGIKDIDLVKKVFPNSPYKEKLVDPQDICFYIAEWFLRNHGHSFAYDIIFQMMLNDETRERLEHVFGFGVLEFRKLYAFGKTTTWKKRMYAKDPKRLNGIELAYLVVRLCLKSLRDVVTFRWIRHRF